MARPIKHGLDYFPLDVDFFEDDKLQFVASRFDEKGELIAIKLLCKIFRSGYFIKWDDDAALLFSKGAGRNITPSLANDVVHELIKRDFFHKGLFERFSVLTSNGIQKRYIKICTDARRKDWEIEEKYNVEEFTPEETQLTPAETSLTPELSTQSKVKESKEKETKGNDSAEAPPSKSFKKFSEQDFIDELLAFKDQYSKEMLNAFFKYWKERSPGGKMKFQLQKTWETKLRLEKWKANQDQFNQSSNSNNNGSFKQNGKHQPAIQPGIVSTAENWGR